MNTGLIIEDELILNLVLHNSQIKLRLYTKNDSFMNIPNSLMRKLD